jgi:hypothetical protein
MGHSLVVFASEKTEQFQQLVLFPELIGRRSIPLDAAIFKEDLPEETQENEVFSRASILAPGQLPLFPLS